MSLPESVTRKLWIDQALSHAGWSPIIAFAPHAPRQRVVLTEHPTANGPADYVLHDQGQPLAVVEAERPSVVPRNVLSQARCCARTLEQCASGETTILADTLEKAASHCGAHRIPVYAGGRGRGGGDAWPATRGAVRAVRTGAGVSGGVVG